MMIEWVSKLIPELAALREQERRIAASFEGRNVDAEEFMTARRICLYAIPENRGRKAMFGGTCIKRKEDQS